MMPDVIYYLRINSRLKGRYMEAHWSSKDITVNGVVMHYTRTGCGDKPPLVLVHGFSDNGLCWAKTARLLEDQYDIIMPDSRGHGRSARVHLGEELDNAGDLAALIQALDLKQPIVAGHSMGAASTSEMGARFPELSRALILEDPPWRIALTAANPHAGGGGNPVMHWAKTLAGKTLDQLIDEYQPEHPTWDPEVLKAWCVGKIELDQNFLELNRMFRSEWQEIVKGIKRPTLLITADSPGGIVNQDTAMQIVQMNPLFKHVRITGTGHHVRFENFADYHEAFTTFIQSLT
jgi:N-formylmaleamate deformylase